MNQSKDAHLASAHPQRHRGPYRLGRLAAGAPHPFEVDLATQYDCSRMTVNKVLTQLAKAGLIERRKKSGSFVTQPQAQSAILEIHDIKAEVQSLNLPYSYAVSKKPSRKAKADDIRRLELPSGVLRRRGRLHP